jgi:F-box-like
MFDQLPAELRLKTFAYLTVRDLRSAQLVSRSWQEFFIANESAIYRHAAVVHGLAPDSETSLAEACSRGSVIAAESWKDLRAYIILYFD